MSLRDDSAASPVWRDPNKTVLRVRDGALIQVPQGEDYKFLADSKRVYVLPQTQKTQLVWLGWNTQDPAVTKLIQGGVNMRIEQVKGPGRSWLILQEGTFGKPKVLADSAASAQDIWWTPTPTCTPTGFSPNLAFTWSKSPSKLPVWTVKLTRPPPPCALR